MRMSLGSNDGGNTEGKDTSSIQSLSTCHKLIGDESKFHRENSCVRKKAPKLMEDVITRYSLRPEGTFNCDNLLLLI